MNHSISKKPYAQESHWHESEVETITSSQGNEEDSHGRGDRNCDPNPWTNNIAVESRTIIPTK